MYRVLFVALLAACGHSKASGPAWPAPSTTADDGGESVAPRETSTVAAAIEKSIDPEKQDEPPITLPPAAGDAVDKPVAAPAAAAPIVEDVITNEEIIIEIDD